MSIFATHVDVFAQYASSSLKETKDWIAIRLSTFSKIAITIMIFTLMVASSLIVAIAGLHATNIVCSERNTNSSTTAQWRWINSIAIIVNLTYPFFIAYCFAAIMCTQWDSEVCAILEDARSVRITDNIIESYMTNIWLQMPRSSEKQNKLRPSGFRRMMRTIINDCGKNSSSGFSSTLQLPYSMITMLDEDAIRGVIREDVVYLQKLVAGTLEKEEFKQISDSLAVKKIGEALGNLRPQTILADVESLNIEVNGKLSYYSKEIELGFSSSLEKYTKMIQRSLDYESRLNALNGSYIQMLKGLNSKEFKFVLENLRKLTEYPAIEMMQYILKKHESAIVSQRTTLYQLGLQPILREISNCTRLHQVYKMLWSPLCGSQGWINQIGSLSLVVLIFFITLDFTELLLIAKYL